MATNNFIKGDKVVCVKDDDCITLGDTYTITRNGDNRMPRAYIIDDDGDDNGYTCDTFELASTPATAVPYQGAMGAANRQAQRKAKLPNPHGQHLPDDEEEDTYDTRKANRSVLSDGLFNKGDVLVYVDGTPTNEPRTVTRCTATCVWFEETYSMPFNPDEFRKPNGDDY